MAAVSYALFRSNRKSPLFGKQAHPLNPIQMARSSRNIDVIRDRRPVVTSAPVAQHVEADLTRRGVMLRRIAGEEVDAVERSAHRLATDLKLDPTEYAVRLWMIVDGERYRILR